MSELKPWEDRQHELNSAKYHTGKPCIDCAEPAGTWWSHLWCFDCNVKRMRRIDKGLEEIGLALKATPRGRAE